MSKLTRNEFAKQFQRFIDKYDRFLLSGHIRPDGDSIGVCYSLGYTLEQMGKEVLVCLDGNADRYLKLIRPLPLLPEDAEMRDASRYFKTGKTFAFIMLDCSEPERTGRAADAILYASASLTIDHHVTSKEAADFNYTEPESSSTCELLYHLMKLCSIPVNREIATALYMGVSFDTGGLRHSNTSADTYQMAADLKQLGVDTTYLTNQLFHTKSMTEMKALSAAIRSSKIYHGLSRDGEKNDILISYLSQVEMTRCGFSAQDADGVVGYLNEIEDAETAVFLREIGPEQIRANMRSKSVVDVARVASLFGGGGHVRAAGCTFQDPPLLVKQKLLEAIHLQLRDLQEEA